MRRPFTLLLLLAGSVAAQPNVRGDVGFSADALLTDVLPAQVRGTLFAHLEADYVLGPVTLNLVLDPSLRLSEGASENVTEKINVEPGLTEAYARFTEGAFDVSAGLERLPLEYARLSLPFSVERTLRRGVRQGVPGARVLWYPGDYRVRAALLYRDALISLVSVKRAFGDFELEGFALYRERAVFGAGGSGLVGDLVVYGEGWLLTAPVEARGALGVTGYLGDSLWTLEGSYALPDGELSLTPDDLPALLSSYPQLLGQLSLPQGEGAGLELLAGVGLPEGRLVGQAGLSYSETSPAGEQVTASLGTQVSSAVFAVTLQLGLKTFF